MALQQVLKVTAITILYEYTNKVWDNPLTSKSHTSTI